MDREKILKFDPISFIYIVIVYCFTIFYIIEKLILLWYLKDNYSKKKLILHSLITLAYIYRTNICIDYISWINIVSV